MKRAATLSGDATIVLPELDAPPGDPIALLRAWLAEADVRGVREPRTLALATAAPGAGPSSRIVLAKALDDRGLVFTTDRASRIVTTAAADPPRAVRLARVDDGR